MLTIVFDLDGTLIDTAPDLISTLNFILSGDGLPPVAYNDGRRMIGGGILGMIKRALNAEGCDPPKPRLIGCFMPSSIITALTSRSAHARSLTSIRSWTAFSVCTNKLEFLSVRLLEKLKLSHHFVAICGQDTFGVHKPDPKMLRQTILRMGGEPERYHGGRFRNGRAHSACSGGPHHCGRFRL
jgi:phosphoglycolate phosphatase